MRAILKLSPVLVLFVLTILFNIGLIDIRFEDINYLLGTIASEDDAAILQVKLPSMNLLNEECSLGREYRQLRA
jgi:hypothetical protein